MTDDGQVVAAPDAELIARLRQECWPQYVCNQAAERIAALVAESDINYRLSVFNKLEAEKQYERATAAEAELNTTIGFLSAAREDCEKAEAELAAAKAATRPVWELADTLKAELDERDAEIEGLRKDAERLDWLQNNLTIIRDIGWIERQDLRKAIDAAIIGSAK